MIKISNVFRKLNFHWVITGRGPIEIQNDGIVVDKDEEEKENIELLRKLLQEKDSQIQLLREKVIVLEKRIKAFETM